jgi:hypothetical protein
MHTFNRTDIQVNTSFIDKFAQKYIDQRSASLTPIKTISSTFLLKNTGFDTTELEKIINKNVIAEDRKREQGLTPEAINDIYRSDLGELLMTYYFEEKIHVSNAFRIPVKNISIRELSQLPGRGLDAIGYRVEGKKIKLLFGEAKVSSSLTSPPAVVHQTDDSIYNTQMKHKGDLAYALKKLSEYYKHLLHDDAAVIGVVIWLIEKNLVENFDITLGCALIRDHSCVNDKKDYGKMKSESKVFDPHEVHFALLTFLGKTIEETVAMFYDEVTKRAA